MHQHDGDKHRLRSISLERIRRNCVLARSPSHLVPTLSHLTPVFNIGHTNAMAYVNAHSSRQAIDIAFQRAG